MSHRRRHLVADNEFVGDCIRLVYTTVQIIRLVRGKRGLPEKYRQDSDT
jgi:hypothetical protein